MPIGAPPTNTLDVLLHQDNPATAAGSCAMVATVTIPPDHPGRARTENSGPVLAMCCKHIARVAMVQQNHGNDGRDGEAGDKGLHSQFHSPQRGQPSGALCSIRRCPLASLGAQTVARHPVAVKSVRHAGWKVHRRNRFQRLRVE